MWLLLEVLCVDVFALLTQVLDPGFRAPYDHVNRWFNTCINQPQFKSVLGDVQFCEKMAQFDCMCFEIFYMIISVIYSQKI